MIKLPKFLLVCSLCSKVFGYSDKEVDEEFLICVSCIKNEIEFEKVAAEVRASQ